MFRKTISENAFCGKAGDLMFENINADSFLGDVSLKATLRALLCNKIPKEESVRAFIGSHRFSKQQLDEAVNAGDNVIEMVYSEQDGASCVLQIVNFSSYNKDDNTAWIDFITENFESKFPDYKRLHKVTEFYKKSFPVVCFINNSSKRSVVFVTNLDVRRLHYLQTAILAFLPWYINPEEGITADGMALLKSFEQSSSDSYEECIEKLASQYDFRSYEIRASLKGFEIEIEKQEKESLARQIIQKRDYVKSKNREISNLLKEIYKSETRLLGLNQRIESVDTDGDSELTGYFLTNKNIELCDVNAPALDFAVRGYIEYYDEDIASRMIKNRSSLIYDRCGGGSINKDDMELLMKAIFIDNIVKIKTCAAYRMYFPSEVEALSRYNFPSSFNDCLPNPHIDRYSCMGNYTTTINELLLEGNYVVAIEQAGASMRSLNFADTTVMEEFISVICNTTKSCFETEDGKSFTREEILEYLKETKENE